MKYRKLDDDGDMVFGHGEKDFYVDSPEAVGQSVLTRLRLWKGEWYLDTDEGTPYMQEVLGKYKESSAVRALYKRVLDTTGVNGIIDFSATLDADTRKLSVTIEIDTVYGRVTVNG